jgi:hypothetical protein
LLAEIAAATMLETAIWTSVGADTTWLLERSRGQSPNPELVRDLANQRLWIDDVRGDKKFRVNLPIWARRAWDHFKEVDRTLGSAFAIWLRWYEGLLIGGSQTSLGASLTDRAAQNFHIFVAAQDRQFWQGGTRAVNDRIRQLIPFANLPQFPNDKQLSHALPISKAGATALEPLQGVSSAFGFQVAAGKVSVTSSPADWPVFPFAGSERDHNSRLEVSRILASDLSSELNTGRFNARPDYADSLKKYAERLPQRAGDGNILLADAEARTLRNMFAADADDLSTGLASKLKTLLEQHIGLRAYYPEIEHFYRDVQTGRIETPLPLDAVQGIVQGVGEYTPDVFDRTVRDAVTGSAEAPSALPIESAKKLRTIGPDQPRPPPDPLGELDPRKARDFTFAGAVNGLWKAFREGEKMHKALKGWKNAGETLQPHVQQVLEWLRNFNGPSDGGPPIPPGVS